MARLQKHEPTHSQLLAGDFTTEGNLVIKAEHVRYCIQVYVKHVSFVFLHGWITTGTEWGIYLSSKLIIGFVLLAGNAGAARRGMCWKIR